MGDKDGIRYVMVCEDWCGVNGIVVIVVIECEDGYWF